MTMAFRMVLLGNSSSVGGRPLILAYTQNTSRYKPESSSVPQSIHDPSAKISFTVASGPTIGARSPGSKDWRSYSGHHRAKS